MPGFRALRLRPRPVNRTTGVLRRRVERIELERPRPRVPDVVAYAGRNQDGGFAFDAGGMPVDRHFAVSILDTEELIGVLVHLLTDFLSRPKRHEYELQVIASMKHSPEVIVLRRLLFDVADVRLHAVLLS
jgi:hypothetical protein